jgi:predicted alpha/beta superfamily hydrolase
MRNLFLLVGILLTQLGTAQLTIIVDQIPANTPAGAEVFIAGNFQNWNPGDQAYKLIENGNGDLEITFTPSMQNMQFKFTRGSWATVEGNENGGFLPDRTYTYSGGQQTLTLQILSWEDTGGSNSTAADNVSIVDTEFYMPQLDRFRKVWIYLPPDYNDNTDNYPVLYMHDGQNVFDASTSFSGEWEVDETLNALHAAGDPGVIVVAVDNGGTHRIDEYSPWVHPTYGGGEGEAYMEFMSTTLKPFIDVTYRTLTDRANTAIMGSSLGGLISHYAAVEFQNVYGKIGIFSPSYWFANEAYTIVSNSTPLPNTRIFMLAGELEGADVVTDCENMMSTFDAAGYDSDNIMLQVDADGQHSEWYWRREFGDAYLWLFDQSNAIPDLSGMEIIQLFPNPVGDSVSISALTGISKADLILELTDLTGRRLIIGKKGQTSLDTSRLPKGNYILRAIMGSVDQRVWQISKQ